MRLGTVAELVRSGMTVNFSAHGNSMSPKIRDGQMVRVEPVLLREVQKGNIVLARVKGKWYLHLVSAIGSEGIQISNAHGHVNGWTRNVVGVLVE